MSRFFVQGLTRWKSRCHPGLIHFWSSGFSSSQGCRHNSVPCICRTKAPTFLLAISQEFLSAAKGCLPFPAMWPLLQHSSLLLKADRRASAAAWHLWLLLSLISRPLLEGFTWLVQAHPHSRRRDYTGHAPQEMGILGTILGAYIHNFLTTLSRSSSPLGKFLDFLYGLLPSTSCKHSNVFGLKIFELSLD